MLVHFFSNQTTYIVQRIESISIVQIWLIANLYSCIICTPYFSEYFFAIDVSLNADNTIVSIVETSECVLNLRIVFASHSYKISFYVLLPFF